MCMQTPSSASMSTEKPLKRKRTAQDGDSLAMYRQTIHSEYEPVDHMDTKVVAAAFQEFLDSQVDLYIKEGPLGIKGPDFKNNLPEDCDAYMYRTYMGKLVEHMGLAKYHLENAVLAYHSLRGGKKD